jgi:hypothetical protein
MANKDDIESMKLELRDGGWNDVTLICYHEGRRTEHTYHNVSKKLVMKLLNGSKTPTVSDFESWLNEEDKKKQERNKGNCVPDGMETWWDCRD